jgi:hypothetical protein
VLDNARRHFSNNTVPGGNLIIWTSSTALIRNMPLCVTLDGRELEKGCNADTRQPRPIEYKVRQEKKMKLRTLNQSWICHEPS